MVKTFTTRPFYRVDMLSLGRNFDIPNDKTMYIYSYRCFLQNLSVCHSSTSSEII